MRNPFRYFNSSPEVIRLVVMMYVRYPLSLRNVEDLLAERGIDISHETVRFRPRRDLELDRRLGYSRARSRPPSAEDLPFDAAVASVRADAAAIRSEAALIFGRAN